MEERVQPAWTPWLCFLVMIEMLQYLAIPFASKIHWDRESTWKLVPEAISPPFPKKILPFLDLFTLFAKPCRASSV